MYIYDTRFYTYVYDNGSTLAHEHTRKSGKLAMILFRVKIARIPGANCTPNRF